MTIAELLALPDEAFARLWRSLPDDEKHALGSQGFDRYRKLTPWVDETVDKLTRAAR